MGRATQSQLQHYCQQLAPQLDAGLARAHGERLGFMVFVFDFGDQGELAYISNAQRDDLKRVVDQLRGYLDILDGRRGNG